MYEENMKKKNYYVLLSPGRAGDWGEVLLIAQDLVKYINGEYEDINQMEKGLVKELLDEIRNDYPDFSDEELEKALIRRLEDTEDLFYFISNLIYEKKSEYFLDFDTIAQMVKFVVKNEVKVIGDMGY